MQRKTKPVRTNNVTSQRQTPKKKVNNQTKQKGRNTYQNVQKAKNKKSSVRNKPIQKKSNNKKKKKKNDFREKFLSWLILILAAYLVYSILVPPIDSRQPKEDIINRTTEIAYQDLSILNIETILKSEGFETVQGGSETYKTMKKAGDRILALYDKKPFSVPEKPSIEGASIEKLGESIYLLEFLNPTTSKYQATLTHGQIVVYLTSSEKWKVEDWIQKILIEIEKTNEEK